jgi:hypothetical protein
LEQEAAAALFAQEQVKLISDANAKLKSQIEIQAELNSIPKVKDFLALVDVERLKAENSSLVAKIERQTRADRGLRVKLEKEAAATKSVAFVSALIGRVLPRRWPEFKNTKVFN